MHINQDPDRWASIVCAAEAGTVVQEAPGVIWKLLETPGERNQCSIQLCHRGALVLYCP